MSSSSAPTAAAPSGHVRGALDPPSRAGALELSLFLAAVWYLVLTSILSVGQYCLERHYARGSSRSLPPTPLQKIRATLLSVRRPKGVTA